ncbi:MAG TPA: hypothetical protein VGJ26_13540 [Pirellulales bacterium]|jgi:hypothetical protein
MFAAVTIAAIGVYWLSRPTVLANRFVRLLQAQEYSEAEKLLLRASDRNQFVAAFYDQDPAWAPQKIERSHVAIRVSPLTFWQIISGARYLHVSVKVEDGAGGSILSGYCLSTAWGVSLPGGWDCNG